MLSQTTHKRLYEWHSVGATWVSIFLLALCLTAIPIIFKDELHTYVADHYQSSPISEESVDYDVLVTTLVSDLGLLGKNLQEKEFYVSPAKSGSHPIVWLFENGKFYSYQMREGNIHEVPELSAVTILAYAHYEFLIPDPYGEYFVGLIGILAMGIVTFGVLLHIKWKKDYRTFRIKRSFRVWISDFHKLAGLWVLPFHIVITYTGATLGLGGLLIILAAYSSFNGDQDAAIEAVLGAETEFLGKQCEMLPIGEQLKKASEHWGSRYGESYIAGFEIHHYGDCSADISISSAIPGYLVASNLIAFSLVNGEVIKEIDWIDSDFGSRWFATLGPLHFGHFAGYFGKWFYVLSALVLSALIISGLLLWVDKKSETPSENKLEYFFVDRLMKTGLSVSVAISSASLVMLLTATQIAGYTELFSSKQLYISSFLIVAFVVYLMPRYLVAYLLINSMLSIMISLVNLDYSTDVFLQLLSSGVSLSLLAYGFLLMGLSLYTVKKAHK